MAGVKRPHHVAKGEDKPESASPYISMFEGFRTELDEHHDRRERVVKASRDITAASKKIIFSLQRARALGVLIPRSIAKDIEPQMSKIKDLLLTVSADLQGIDAYRYQRNISSGIQEYMEAALFQYYLETQKVMEQSDAAKALPQDLSLTYEDYLLGLFDMTGELMKFTITYMATNGSLPGISSNDGSGVPNVLADMQTMKLHLDVLDPSGSFVLGRDFDSKLTVTKASVEKVECSVYSMIVRGKERPKGWRPDASFAEGPQERDQIETY